MRLTMKSSMSQKVERYEKKEKLDGQLQIPCQSSVGNFVEEESSATEGKAARACSFSILSRADLASRNNPAASRKSC